MSAVPYKWIVATVFVIGLFMDLLDSTVVNVAIPTLAAEFEAGTTTVEWVVTGYLLSLAVFIPVSGWAGDRFGTKRIFMTALTVFTVASVMCAVAPNIQVLIAFRVLQGIGGGMLTPVGTAMLFRAFPPEERAKASAVLVIPIAVSPALGPIIGGYLVEYQEWRWIFLINIPIGLLGIVVSAVFLREEKQPSPGAFDVPGFLLGATGLASLVYALAEAGGHGFTDPRVVGFGLVGVALMTAFTLVELRVEHPMLDVRLFRDSLFRACNSISVASAGGLIGAIFLLPLLLQSQMGFSPFEAGLTTFPQALGVSIMAPIAGQLYMHIGPRRMLAAGMFSSMVTSLAFVAVDVDTSVWAIAGVLLLRGMGFGLALIPLQAATYATISPRDTGRATAITNVVFQVAGAFGVALLATVLTNRLAAHGATLGDPSVSEGALAAFHDAFIAAAALSAVAAVIALVLVDDRKAVHTMQKEAVVPAGH